MVDTGYPSQRLFGRRKGRPLHTRKRFLMETLLPRLKVNLPEQGSISPRSFFDNVSICAPVWMEIGFGGGEHLAAQAALKPDALFIGCEPFLNGVASLLDHLSRENLQNVRIYDGDARRVLDVLEDASLEGCFILFPDPWPKKRHIERRFIGPENLDRLAHTLRPGGLLRFASDHPALVDWTRACLAERTDFDCLYQGTQPPEGWIKTRYQEKAVAAGRQLFFADWRASKPFKEPAAGT
ncbi:MAG: tRNA (guanosine(46)-N7)-methyltransferase TrmB [Alphaproteobacteria bacterium]|nr:tRNA (guanosine(46)-N7)-methyltransferase TrmB [Alphaproteobacteria bacterium]